MLIDLKDIIVEERQREELGDIPEQAESMKQFGQLQPIIVELRQPREGETSLKYILRAGGRRLAAAAVLGWTQIEAGVRGEMSPLTAQLIELEENIRRKDLTWQEKTKAVERIHRLKVEELGSYEWTVEKTAAMVGIGKRHVHNMVELAGAIEKDADLAKSDSQHTAMKKLQRNKEIEKRQIDVQLRQVAVNIGLKKNLDATIVQQKFCEGLEALEPESVDLVLTDPPYGVDYDTISGADMTQFQDDLEYAEMITRLAMKGAFAALKNDRWVFMFWPTIYWELGKNILTDAGFAVAPKPVIWHKPNKHFTRGPDTDKAFNSQYEMIIVAKKGNPIFHEIPPGDVLSHDTVGNNRYHPTQKPLTLLLDLIKYATLGGEVVCDPFSGSGSCGVAAVRLERNFRGFEKNPEYLSRAQLWLQEELQGVPTPTAVTDGAPEVESGPSGVVGGAPVLGAGDGFDTSLFQQ